MKRRIMRLVMALVMLLNTHVVESYAGVDPDNSCNDYYYGEVLSNTEKRFDLGNKTKVIFQDGLELALDSGYYYVTCSKCGHVDTEAIPMTAHKYNKKGKCKVCGAQK